MVAFFKLAAMKEHYDCKNKMSRRPYVRKPYEYKARITRVQTAGFIAYCTVTCNGSSDIAEIIRRLAESYGMDERESPGEKTYGSEKDVFGLLQSDYVEGDLYTALYNFSRRRMSKAPGSCRQSRHTFSSMGKSFVQETYLSDDCNVRKLLTYLDECSSQCEGKGCTNSFAIDKILHHDLQPKLESLDGIGPFNVHHVIHLSALLGLLPIKALCFATLSPSTSSKCSSTSCEKRGPVKFIKKTCFEILEKKRIRSTLPISIVQEIFEHVFAEVGKLLESRYFQKLTFENILCELNRIFEHYSKKTKTKDGTEVSEFTVSRNPNLTNVIPSLTEMIFSKQNTEYDIESIIHEVKKIFELPEEELSENPSPSSCDAIYLDYTMCEERRFQPMFRVRFDWKIPHIQMYSHILRRDGTHSIESIQIANWVPGNDSSDVHWRDKKMDSTLSISDRITERFLPRYCHDGMKCSLCMTSDNSEKKCRTKNSNTKSKGLVIKTADSVSSRQFKCLYNQEENAKQKKKVSYPSLPNNYLKVAEKEKQMRNKPGYKKPNLWEINNYDEESHE